MVVWGSWHQRLTIVSCVAALAGPPAVAHATPTVQFGTYKGGAAYDGTPDVDFDSNLSMTVAGVTGSSSGVAKALSWDTSMGGDGDGFIAQYDRAGVLTWATYVGASGWDKLFAVAHDSSDQVYAGGSTASSSGILIPDADPVHQSSLGGETDGLLVKFSSAGAPIWATYFGGPGVEEIKDICVGSDGSVFATGYTTSTSGIAASATHHGSLGSTQDAFIAKFTSSGTLSWATYYGGTDGDTHGLGCAVDSSGNVIVVGDTMANNGIANSGWDGAYSDGKDGFIAKLSSSGTWLWGTYYGSSGIDGFVGVAVDASDNIYVAGSTTSGNTGNVVAGGTGAFDTTPNGGYDGLIAKFTSGGSRSWGSYYGGSGQDGFAGIDVHGTDVFLAGWTSSTSGIATAGSLDTSYNGGGYDGMFVMTGTSGGTPWYGMYLGGSDEDPCYRVAGSSTGDVALAGDTQSNSGVATTGADDTSFGGVDDVYLKYIQMWPT